MKIQEIIDAVVVYDNGGKTLDRYSIILKNYRRRNHEGKWLYECLSVNEGGDGFSQFCEAMRGRHLGKIIEFKTLSKATQNHIIGRLV